MNQADHNYGKRNLFLRALDVFVGNKALEDGSLRCQIIS